MADTGRAPRGIALHIGVNEVDPAHYAGWSGPLKCCENDAHTMRRLAIARGYETGQLLTAEATREAVSGSIRAAAAALVPGDIFLVSYAGHGGQVADVNGDEEDLKDETWCLFDGQLLDDELHVLWSEFQPGVRVLVVSDSCHSGTVTKGSTGARVSDPDPSLGEPRFMPRQPALDTFARNKGFYARLQVSLPDPRPRVRASVRLLSGCQEHQYSYEANGSGRFTAALVKHYADGTFNGDYDDLHRRIVEELGEKQQPNHAVIGGSDAAYDRQAPFSI